MIRKYDGILIAPDYYGKRFDDNIMQMLDNHRDALYVAETYDKMVQYIEQRFLLDKSVGSYSPKDIFRENKSILSGYRLTRARGKSGGKGDIMSVARSMSAEHKHTGAKYLLISSDITLIQLVVFDRLEIDLYDAYAGTWIAQSEFPKYHDSLRYSWEGIDQFEGKNPVLPMADTDSDELDLFDDEGRAYHLKRYRGISEGSEALMYICDDEPDYLAKVFDRDNDSLTQTKSENIRQLYLRRDLFPFAWLILPKKLLYLEKPGTDPRTGEPIERHLAGFFMDNVKDFKRLGDEEFADSGRTGQKVSRGLMFARDLLWQILFLASFNIRPFDFNRGNFGSSGMIVGIAMVDTDSFCGYGHLPNLQDSCYSGTPKLAFGKTTIEETIRSCVRMTYIFLAHMLMRGQNALFSDKTINPVVKKEYMYRIPQPVREPLLEALVCPGEEIPYYDAILVPLVETMLNPYYQECTYEDLERRDYSEAPKKESGWDSSKVHNGPKEPKQRPRKEPVEDTLFVSEKSFDPTVSMRRGGRQVRVIHPRKNEKKTVQLVPVPARKMYTLPKLEEDVQKKRERRLRRKRLWMSGLLLSLLLIFWMVLFADIGRLDEFQSLLTGIRERFWDWLSQLRAGPGVGAIPAVSEWLRLIQNNLK